MPVCVVTDHCECVYASCIRTLFWCPFEVCRMRVGSCVYVTGVGAGDRLSRFVSECVCVCAVPWVLVWL